MRESPNCCPSSIFPSAPTSKATRRTPPKKIEKLEKELKKLQKERAVQEKSRARFDEEHNLWEVRFVNSQGAEHLINWELASTPEYRQMLSKFKQIEPYMEPPFVVETVAKDVSASSDEAEDELSRSEAEDAGEGVEKKTAKPPPRRKPRRAEVVEKDISRASCSITFSARARKTSPCSATKVWAK